MGSAVGFQLRSTSAGDPLDGAEENVAAKEFTGLVIIGGDTDVLKLSKIPAGLNGWSVYCRYSNHAGHTDTDKAKLTVTGGEETKPFDYTGTFNGADGSGLTLEIKGKPELYEITVKQTGSDGSVATWTFSGKFSDTGVLQYSNGAKTVVKDGVTTEIYKNGTGKLAYVDGSNAGVHWTEDQSTASEKTVFLAKS